MTSEAIYRTLSFVLKEMKSPEWVLSSRVIEADFLRGLLCLLHSEKIKGRSVIEQSRQEETIVNVQEKECDG